MAKQPYSTRSSEQSINISFFRCESSNVISHLNTLLSELHHAAQGRGCPLPASPPPLRGSPSPSTHEPSQRWAQSLLRSASLLSSLLHCPPLLVGVLPPHPRFSANRKAATWAQSLVRYVPAAYSRSVPVRGYRFLPPIAECFYCRPIFSAVVSPRQHRGGSSTQRRVPSNDDHAPPLHSLRQLPLHFSLLHRPRFRTPVQWDDYTVRHIRRGLPTAPTPSPTAWVPLPPPPTDLSVAGAVSVRCLSRGQGASPLPPTEPPFPHAARWVGLFGRLWQ